MFHKVLLCCLVITSAEAICVGSRQNSTCVSLRERIRERLFFKTVCYAEVGCFYTGPPFYHPVHRPISLPPESPDVLQPRFMLYTRRNRYRPIFLEDGNVRTLKKSTFNPRAITRIITHGYLDGIGITTWPLSQKDAILNVGDDNVILFDWSGGSGLLYSVATANTRTAGALMANLIRFLITETGIRPERFHLLGHSLGAHIAGYAGRRIKNIGRISGFDPAGPLFNYMPDAVVLDPGDALFVDNLHTDQGEVIVDGLGTSQDDGDIDFWVWNGKVPLLACTDVILEGIARASPTEVGLNLASCRHRISIEFYTYSFNQSNCLFVGVKCRSWEEFLAGLCDCGENGERCKFMGFFAEPPSADERRDDFRHYLITSLRRPYCVHQYVLKIYVRNFHPMTTEQHEDFPAAITLVGHESKLKAQLNMRISTKIRLQRLSFLLTNDKPVGVVHSGVMNIGSNYTGVFESNELKQTGFSVEKIEVTYLYPLPKAETTFLLCKMRECSTETCQNLSFSQKFCDFYRSTKKLLFF